ncbi:hypothetical protein MKW92_038592 [Papaver armeniacum]|nr:hypothetical protein MKW92_038592 [Papaver armeniacum]
MYRLASKVVSSISSSSAKKLVGSRVLQSRNYAAKDINFGVSARAAMLQGVTQVANAVKVTMGPKGRNVIIESSFGAPKVTKDGVTVAKSISFQDKAMNVGASLVKQVATATNTTAGDGTTCATVLTQAILTEGCKSVAAGVNVMDLRQGINMAVNAVIADLKSKALMISTPEEISQVGTISANGEREIGEMLARAMEKVGKEGVITVADGNTMENELEIVEGMKLGRGFISPYFITDEKTQKCELDHPLILIHDKKISDMASLVKILEMSVTKNRPLLIVAEDVESEALNMLILNKYRAGVKVCAIKSPGFGENRRANLEDLAVLTGGQLRTSLENSSSMFDKEKAQERLSKLSGGVAVFKVGGASEAEVGERKDRVIDALNATKAAVEEGILPGGGVALLYSSRVLDNLQTANNDQKRGVEIIQNALKAPTFTISENAGVNGAVVIGKLLDQDNVNLGYDAAKGVYVNMVEAGIIDPLKVIRTALVDAASVSLLLTTTEASIVESADGKSSTPSRMPQMGDY